MEQHLVWYYVEFYKTTRSDAESEARFRVKDCLWKMVEVIESIENERT